MTVPEQRSVYAVGDVVTPVVGRWAGDVARVERIERPRSSRSERRFIGIRFGPSPDRPNSIFFYDSEELRRP